MSQFTEQTLNPPLSQRTQRLGRGDGVNGASTCWEQGLRW
jgi:hypothetical protein